MSIFKGGFYESIYFFIYFFFQATSLMAKSPLTSRSEEKKKKRCPAAREILSEKEKEDRYFKMSCDQLTDPSSKDEFIIYFRKEVSKLDPDLCDLVLSDYDEFFDGSSEFDELSELNELNNSKQKIGPGSFSKMIGVYYNAFKEEKKEDRYFDMSCMELMDAESEDEFIVFFRKEVSKFRPNLCEGVQDIDFYDEEMGDYLIGLGTFSKMVESYYGEFYYLKNLGRYQKLSCSELMDRDSKDRFIVFFRKYAKNLDAHFCDKFSSSNKGKEDLFQAVEDGFNKFYYSKENAPYRKGLL